MAAPPPLLTALIAPESGHEEELTHSQKQMLRADAKSCLDAMLTRGDEEGPFRPRAEQADEDLVAAALALMGGVLSAS